MAAARDRAGFLPEEALDAAAALALFTAGAARAIGEDARLEPGAPATLTVLDGDPTAAPLDELRRLQVLATFVAGRPVSAPEGRGAWRD
jgi:hypothetical protein